LLLRKGWTAAFQNCVVMIIGSANTDNALFVLYRTIFSMGTTDKDF